MPKFEKRHYDCVAEVLRRAGEEATVPEAQAIVHFMCNRFSELFARDNDRFDRPRFEAACKKHMMKEKHHE